ncbi:MAG: phenylalanine--tRNA ligase beta subunit [Gemmatimonadota bacterium]|nr:MAG: phenylalanine--tRNA ligase beta subunit [Gemmatimonadota bacterium]
MPWLESFVELPSDGELATRLTAAGLECEVDAAPAVPDGVVTGRILSCEKHPDADRLSVCLVDVGDGGEPRSIVCGAPNAQADRIGACALPGTDFGNGFVIAKRKLRGVPSEGMLCSESELGLSDDHDGILFLPDDTPLGRPVGEILTRPRVLVTEALSNRGDWMSVRGVAREVSAVTGAAWKQGEARPVEADAGAWRVEIDDPADCPRYAGRVIEGLTVGDSPEWIAERLTAAGVRPISNLVDVTNYVLLEHGHPLHAFDLDKLTGTSIGVRRARGREALTTLDGKAHELTSDVLLITDGSGPVAAGGVMGGEATMVSEATTRVFLEGASFSPGRIRAGARSLRLTTDASARFERGVDPEGVPGALDRATELLLEMCPGARLTHAVDSYPEPAVAPRIALRRRTLPRLLGMEFSDEDVLRIFVSLGITLESADAEAWTVRPPSFRRDLLAEEDLVEEVARIHGYDRIPERMRGHTSRHVAESPRIGRQARSRRLLLSLGLVETITPSLVDRTRENAHSQGGEFFRDSVPLRNPLSQDRDALRGSLIPSLVQVLATNRARATSDLALFEVGRTWGGNPAGHVDERLRAAILLSGSGLDASGSVGGKSCDFFDMRGLLEVYVEGLWGHPLRLEEGAPSPLKSGRSASLFVQDQCVGFLGEAGASLRTAFDLPNELPVILAELDLEVEIESARSFEFAALPRYPGVHRDLAFVVQKRVRHADLASALTEAAGPLLVESRLFDVYEGAPLADTEKSLAFMLVFRSPERSLTHEEVDERVDAIVEHLKGLGARIR